MIVRSKTVLLLLLVFTRSLAQHSLTDKDLLHVDSLLKTIYKNDAPGISIAIVKNGNVIFRNGYGLATLETKKSLGSSTSFNIGSITKQFTALCILQLAESKKLSLDDHLSKFFPELNKKVADMITIKELLIHSSGIIDHYGLTDTNTVKHAHINDVLHAVQNTDSTYFTPGSHFRYSNTAYSLLSLIVERASGASYPQYLKKNIFDPTGMTKTVVWSENEKIEREASGYEFDSATHSFKKSGADENIFFSTEGDGGLYMSTDDYLKWFSALQSGKVFPKEIIRQARSPHFSIDKERHLSYGYG